MTNKTQDTRAIDAYNFMDFVILSEKAREDGYVFDFTTNATAPANLGFRYFAVMRKGTKSILPESTKQVREPSGHAQQEKAPKKTEDKVEDTQKQPEVKEEVKVQAPDETVKQDVVEVAEVETEGKQQRNAKKSTK